MNADTALGAPLQGNRIWHFRQSRYAGYGDGEPPRRQGCWSTPARRAAPDRLSIPWRLGDLAVQLIPSPIGFGRARAATLSYAIAVRSAGMSLDLARGRMLIPLGNPARDSCRRARWKNQRVRRQVSQAPLALDLVPGGVDPRHLVAGPGNKILRHAARGEAVRVVLPHQLLPGVVQVLAAGGTRHAQHRIGIRRVAGGVVLGGARCGAARPVPGWLVEP